MHKKAYLKHLENVGIEDPGTSKTLSFVDTLLKHDAQQYNSTFGKKLTAHTKANTPLSNDHLTKETDELEKNAAMPDIRGSLSKLVSSFSGAAKKSGSGGATGGMSNTQKLRAINPNVDKMIAPKSEGNKPLAYSPTGITTNDKPREQINTAKAPAVNSGSKTGVAGAMELPAEAYRTGSSRKAEKGNTEKTPAPKMTDRSTAKASAPQMTGAGNTAISPGIPAMTDRNTAMTPAPKMTQQQAAPIDPNKTFGPNAPITPETKARQITPNVTMAQGVLPQETQAMNAVNAQQPGMITPNVTQANLHSVNPVAPAPGKNFGAVPFDPNGTMANRAILPNVPRGETQQPRQANFGAVPFDQSQYQTGQIPGIPQQNAPIMPQQTAQNPAIQPQQQGPQFNTGDINAVTSGIGQRQMQGGLGMSNSQANQAISGLGQQQMQGGMGLSNSQANQAVAALGPQKQNAVDPNASAAQQAAQAQQQPKVVNNTMKPQPEPKQEAQPATPSKESETIAKQKEQLTQLKQKTLAAKLQDRIKALEQGNKEKAKAETEKPKAEDSSPKDRKVTKDNPAVAKKEAPKKEEATTKKVEAPKPEANTKKIDTDVETKKTQAITPKSDSESGNSDNSGKTRRLDMFEQADLLRGEVKEKREKTQAMTPENSKKEGKVRANVPLAVDPEIDKLNQVSENNRKEKARFEAARDEALKKRDQMEKAKTEPIKPRSNEEKEKSRLEKADTEAMPKVESPKSQNEPIRAQNTERFPDAVKPQDKKGRTQAINPDQQASLRDETSDQERKQTGKYERPTQDNGEALGNAQSGKSRDANYAVGYTGEEKSKPQSIFGKARDAFKTKVEDMKARVQSKKPKSVQQMDAIPEKPANVFTDKPKYRGEPKVNVEEGSRSGGTSPITGEHHPHSEQGQKKIHEHLLSALGQTKAEAKQKWDSLPKDQQKGAMIGATLLAATGLGVAMKRSSNKRRERDREERRRDMQEMLAASRGGQGGGQYYGGGYGRY